MPRLSASLSKEQYGWVESQSESRGESMAEVIRYLIDKERGVLDESPIESHPAVDLESLVNQVESLEQRVSELEDQQGPTILEHNETVTDSAQSDLIEYVQSNQPVSKADIVADCYPENSPLKQKTWWETRAREELKDSGFEFVRNVGWLRE